MIKKINKIKDFDIVVELEGVTRLPDYRAFY